MRRMRIDIEKVGIRMSKELFLYLERSKMDKIYHIYSRDKYIMTYEVKNK